MMVSASTHSDPRSTRRQALLVEEDVDQDDVGMQDLELTERVGARRGDARYLKTLTLEEHARRFEERLAVVHDQKAHHVLSLAPILWARITASRNPKG
jgi:hypothetical protein